MIQNSFASTFRLLALVPVLCLGQSAARPAFENDPAVSKSEFFKIPHQETAGVIGILPGMWVKEMGVQGQWNPLRFRGSEYSQSVLLINGFNFNDPLTGMPDLNFLPEAWLDSVKCLSAPAFSNPNAIGAVIDAASGRELAPRPLTSIAYSKTSDGFGRTSGSFSKAVSNRLTLGAAAAFRNTGETALPPASDDVTVHGRARFRISANWGMEYFFGQSGSESDLDFPSVIPGDSAVSGGVFFKRNQTQHILTVTSGIFNTRLSLRRSSYRYSMESGSDVSIPKTSVLLEQSSVRRIPLMWGFQSEWDAFRTDGFDSGSRWTGSAHVGTRASLLPDLVAGAQARIHRSGDGGLNLLAAFATDWVPRNGFKAWVSAHRGIRDPSLGEWTGRLFMPFPAVTPGEIQAVVPAGRPAMNPSLRPELSLNIETGFETIRAPWMRARLCAFGRRVEDAIERSASGEFLNGGTRRFLGAECSVELGPWRGFSGHGSINYLNTENEDGGLLFDRPNFHGSGHVSWQGSLFRGDLAPAAAVRLRSWSEFWNSLTGTEGSSSALLPPASMIDVRLSAAIMKKAAVYWMMENVMGTNGWSVAGFPLPVRITTFGLTWELLD